MLFLYRPPQTYMPYAPPRGAMQQDEYRWNLQQKYEASRRVPPPAPKSDPIDDLERLGRLHESGVLTDDEFAAAKAKVLG